MLNGESRTTDITTENRTIKTLKALANKVRQSSSEISTQNWKHARNLGNEFLNTQKKWTMKSTEARISKPNLAKITSASSQKKIPAETYCREKQSLLFTEAVLGFN